MKTPEATHDTLRIQSDTEELHIHRWAPSNGEIRARLLVIHGYAEHAERYRELALRFAPLGIEVTAPDLRGHGRSTGPRGHIRTFDAYVRDAEAAFATLGTHAPRFILGHSNGGLIALDYMGRRPPEISGLIVTNPYLELEMKIPRVKALAGHLVAKVHPRFSVPSGIPPEVVSRDPEIVAAYQRDPLIFSTATVGYVVQQRKAAKRVQDMKQLGMDLLYIYSDSDPLVSPSANARLANRLISPNKSVWVREGERHEVLNELGRSELHGKIANWIITRCP